MDKRIDGLTLVSERDGMKLYTYKPTIFHPLLKEFAPMLENRRLRFLRNYFRPGRYIVYYMESNEELVGMCVVTPGGPGLKLKSTKNDIVLGPDYIKPEQRGKGYSKILIRWVLEVHPKFDYAYAIISNSNIASQRGAIAAGLKPYMYVRLRGLMKVHESCEKSASTHMILRSA